MKKAKEVIALMLALSCSLSLAACAHPTGSTGSEKPSDEELFAQYQQEQTAYLSGLAEEDDSAAVTQLLEDAVGEIEDLLWQDNLSLEGNKELIDKIVEDAVASVRYERADIADYVADGYFKENFYVSMDTSVQTGGDATFLSVAGLVAAMTGADSSIVETLSAAETATDYMTSSALYFLPDGTVIMEYDFTDDMMAYWHLLDANMQSHYVTTGTYSMSMTPEEGTKKYPIVIGDSTYYFDVAEEMITGHTYLASEIYYPDDSLTLPTDVPREDPYQDVVPGGTLEKKYLAYGAYEVASETFASGQADYDTFKVWYPEEMLSSDTQYPLVVMVNGTGTPYTKYEYVFEHLASWGFIVAGNNDENAGTGDSTEQLLQFVLDLNRNKESVFYGKIDEEAIGVAGHSQGGAGAINAATAQPSAKTYRSIYAASATCMGIAEGLGYPYDPSKINAPIFMNTSTGDFDQIVLPLFEMEKNYDAIVADVPVVMAQYQGIDHGDMLAYADAYMTAWFLYTLCGDAEAGKVFTGDAPEIESNANWINVKEKGLDESEGQE